MKRLRVDVEKSIEEVEVRLIHRCALRAKREGKVFELWYNPSINKEMKEILCLLERIEKRYVITIIQKTNAEKIINCFHDLTCYSIEMDRKSYKGALSLSNT